MANDFNFKIKGLDKLIISLNDMDNNFNRDLQALVEKHGGKLWKNAKNKTPVGQYNDGRTGGTLKRNWTLEKGDLYVRVFNNTKYGLSI